MNDVQRLLSRLDSTRRNRQSLSAGVDRMWTVVRSGKRKWSGVSSGFAGDTTRALHRTRTGDPFLTMQSSLNRWKWRIACVISVCSLFVGLVIVSVFGGSDAP
jgi:aryl-alcohol dehydrogenase-like predicted oxidoreductase